MDLDKQALDAAALAFINAKFGAGSVDGLEGNEVWVENALASNELQAAIRAYLDALPKEGWVLVPKEPTREMWAAGGTASLNSNLKHHDVAVEAVWSAMIAASPPPGGSEP